MKINPKRHVYKIIIDVSKVKNELQTHAKSALKKVEEKAL